MIAVLAAKFAWELAIVATVFAIIIYRQNRRANPTAPKWLLALRAIGFFLWLGGPEVTIVLSTHWKSTFRNLSVLTLSYLGLGIGFLASQVINHLYRKYQQSLQPLKSTPAPVYIDGGPNVWPPPPSSRP